MWWIHSGGVSSLRSSSANASEFGLWKK